MENDLTLVDSEALLAIELKLWNYLDDGTIPFEEQEKRVGEYEAFVGEIVLREKTE